MDDKTITRLSESIAELFAVQGESCMDILDEILDGIYHQGDIYTKEALSRTVSGVVLPVQL